MSFSKTSCDSEIPADKAAKRAKELSTGSWERGTCAEALLELYNPELSVFAFDPFPGGALPVVKPGDIPSLRYAHEFISTNSHALQHDDDRVGVSDPASIGVAADLIGRSQAEYAAATKRQTKHLLETAPRYSNGAISHRLDVIELWADYVYMAPPFLAYHAVATECTAILRVAIEQCKLYREVLITQEGRAAGLWKHIIGSKHEDLGYWSTSCGWAAAGMVRVLATLMRWPETRGWTAEAEDLKFWIREILDGAIRTDDEESTGLLRNYLNDNSWWGDVAGTALLASVVYRMTVLAPEVINKEYLDWAHRKLDAVVKHVDAETGIAAPTVNPRSHLQREKLLTGSPEAQSFLVLLHAAYRDWHNRS